jgi:nucleoside-diphosphate-sugar epimerase
MIIGSGLLASTFAPHFRMTPSICIYAAGVSNSRCTELAEFERERVALLSALANFHSADAFVYFGTCSVADPTAVATPYVQHKLAMEQLVMGHPGHLILRLPQIAANTGNPHTLLNTLHRHLATGDEFPIWRNAYRNIIDIEDVLGVASRYVADARQRKRCINIANPSCAPIGVIVAAMERAMGAKMKLRWIERGAHYPIDVAPMLSSGYAAHCQFGADYLDRVIAKYHAPKQHR